MTSAIDVRRAREALAALPEGTSHGETPAPDHVYLPPSHIKAMAPDTLVVTGMRGAGKTFWWSALQDPGVRRLIGRSAARSALGENAEVRTGFGIKPAPEDYPSKDMLRRLLAASVEPRTIWRTVQSWHIAPDDHPLRRHATWEDRVRHVDGDPEQIDRLFQQRDTEFNDKGSYFLVLFDALDRCSDDWKAMYRLIRGLMQAAIDVRSYRRLRIKVFLRFDQVAEAEIDDFPDASKALSSAVELSWPVRDLYGLLWHHLGNRPDGESFRTFLDAGDWPSVEVTGRRLYSVPRRLIRESDYQRRKFHKISGPWMDADHRRGFPYTWIPNHLTDTEGRVSPRSFLAALRTAAEDTENERPDHQYALHYDSIKRGVQEVSAIRVRELQEDYPWMHRALEHLAGMVVPCEFDEIAARWRAERVFDRLAEEMKQDEVKLTPRGLAQGPDGVRKDIESLGVFQRLQDGRVNIPDVFLVGYGLGRKGGVEVLSPSTADRARRADRVSKEPAPRKPPPSRDLGVAESVTVQENPRRMRARVSHWNLHAWLKSLAALATILGILGLSLSFGGDRPDVPWGKNTPVPEFVENIREISQGLMASLESAPGGLFDSSVLQSRQRLELLADQMEMVARRWADETYEDLDDAEYEFLRVLGAKLYELNESLPVTPDVVDDALADVSKRAVDELSAVRAYPIVLGYTPLFVLSGGGGSDDAVHVEVAGSPLTSGNPSLTIGNDRNNNKCRPATDGVLAFLCSRNLFPAGDGFQTGILRVYREPGFFERLLGSDPVEYSYSISIKVVPGVMGRAMLSVTRQQQTERQFKSQNFSDRNGHCESSYDKSFPFNASDGWEIDTSSIDATCLDVSSRSTCNGIRDITERSFTYSCRIANAGTCGPFWRDGRGSCRGVVTWEEVRDVAPADRLLEAELRWSKEERIELPEGTRSVQGAIDGIDGIRRTFGNMGISDSWFDVDVNLEDRYVVIRPAELDAAMRRGNSGTE